jgi:hypothetical protein
MRCQVRYAVLQQRLQQQRQQRLSSLKKHVRSIRAAAAVLACCSAENPGRKMHSMARCMGVW